MSWAPSVAGWLGGFLLVPGEVGEQGPQHSFLSPVLCSASSPSPHLPLHMSTP
uniref:Interleukin 10 receptor, beta n=1 Tax=Mus musculus TaxID=10090 RepID=E9Q294_MOUSE